MNAASRLLAFIIIALLYPLSPVAAQRRITPVNTPATATQPRNEFEGDTARINAKKRATMVHYHDDKGNIIYIDTVTGEEWRDSTAVKEKKAVVGNLYPLWQSVTVGVNVFDPIMRALGRGYGVGEVWALVNLHNRYQPVLEVGLGQAKTTPEDANYTYSSALAPYFKIGCNYNFFYNNTPDYQLYAGLRLGLTSFSYKLTDVHTDDGYWDESMTFDIPRQSSTAFYYEIVLGCKVKLFKNISAGWSLRYHRLLAESGGTYGNAWYIPGFGTRGNNVSATFSIMYTLPIDKSKRDPLLPDDDMEDMPVPPPPSENAPDGILPGRVPGVGPDVFNDNPEAEPSEA